MFPDMNFCRSWSNRSSVMDFVSETESFFLFLHPHIHPIIQIIRNSDTLFFIILFLSFSKSKNRIFIQI